MAQDSKACNAGVWGSIPWRREWQPTPVLLPGQSHGQRSLVGYSPWGRKESDMTEQLHFFFFLFFFLSWRILKSAKNLDGRSVEVSDNKFRTNFFQNVREREPEIRRL